MFADTAAKRKGRNGRGGGRGGRGKNAIRSPDAAPPPPEQSQQNKTQNVGRERSLISKQAAALERAESLFYKHVSSSSQRLPTALDEITACIKRRGDQLNEELESFRQKGVDFFKNRREAISKAKELCDSGIALTDGSLEKLRLSVKALEKDARLEADLVRVIPFEWEPDELMKLAGTFGRINDSFKSTPKGSSVLPSKALSMNGSSNEVKPVSTVNLGAISMESENLDAKELLSLSMQVKNMLHVSGISEDLLPAVTGESGAVPGRTLSSRGRGRGRRRAQKGKGDSRAQVNTE